MAQPVRRSNRKKMAKKKRKKNWMKNKPVKVDQITGNVVTYKTTHLYYYIDTGNGT